MCGIGGRGLGDCPWVCAGSCVISLGCGFLSRHSDAVSPRPPGGAHIRVQAHGYIHQDLCDHSLKLNKHTKKVGQVYKSEETGVRNFKTLQEMGMGDHLC